MIWAVCLSDSPLKVIMVSKFLGWLIVLQRYHKYHYLQIFTKKKLRLFFKKNTMEDFMETIYAQEAKEAGCKTCKTKPKILKNWTTWFGVWMFIMSIYGNFVFFKQIIKFIFE